MEFGFFKPILLEYTFLYYIGSFSSDDTHNLDEMIYSRSFLMLLRKVARVRVCLIFNLLRIIFRQ